jgi:predicted N-acetyltransferase YhbS
MEESDIPAGIRLCRAAGWNQLEQDWKMFLDMQGGDAFVAADEHGNIVGTVASMRYQNKFAWIGMMLVDPERRRQGIAMLLMQHILEELKDLRSVKLDATPAGREVYLRLGFKDEYILTRWLCDQSLILGENHDNVRAMTEDDLQAVLDLDRKVFGAERSELIKHFWREQPGFARVLIKENKVVGYTFGRKGFSYYSIGPVVATGTSDAQKLIATVMSQAHDMLMIIDVPQQHEALAQWLSEVGFKKQRDLIRMYRGSNEWPGMLENQFSILGPAFG